ncbi:hypothetical protein HMPREF1059_04253 [Parabacteroides distasonis CL09T03C24]|uniref:Uncharacterized protein n=1 Tax=Parabacteroides distasonis CL09T03C24 TaxID=999417 RepID=A0AAD2TL47_PARDI|nr:hypothetical protein HMPREF1059_04253 [Parabacteroides distasonis CL09T03C24]
MGYKYQVIHCESKNICHIHVAQTLLNLICILSHCVRMENLIE